ncbi:MAG: glycoside hydrolase family 127 protein, partial [Saprospiraceae bacterium]|nr:glycoside hydrolase family 127 protein [Saprospiraceae bacterium]
MIANILIAQMQDYPIQPVPFNQVEINDNFWLPRLKTTTEVSIPFAFKQSEETGRIRNFAIAGGLQEGQFQTGRPYDDSDVFKIIEGASYALSLEHDEELDAYLDSLIYLIAAAQEDDGYLMTWRTINPDKLPIEWAGDERWANLESGHELYNVGHLYEAAVAHFQATGKRSLLDVALKNANLIYEVFGPGKREGYPGHQEIEIGLVKLYRVSGDQRYLELAELFLDRRGNREYQEAGNAWETGEYWQDHVPVTEQSEAVGHAVRAGYMYAGMADVAAITGREDYIRALELIWDNVVSKKYYITGGVGASHSGEAFGPNYHLPNAEAYNETCAAIAQDLWNFR